MPTLSLAALMVLGCPALVLGQATGPATASDSSRLDVQEWAVFVLDASSDKLNSDGIVQSTLPPFVSSHRQAAPADAIDKPSPVGVIRLIGSAADKVDVKIEKTAGAFLSSWPKAQARSNALLWQDLTVSDNPSGQGVEPIADGHWFARLRAAASAYVSNDKGAPERFLLYDVELPYACPLKVTHGDGGRIVLNNASTVALHDLFLYHSDHGTHRQAAVGELPAFTAPPKTGEAATRTVLPSTGPATTPSTQTASAPASQTSVLLMPAASDRPADVAANWKPILSRSGLSPTDVQLIADMISQYALGSRALTAIYRLDPAEFDRLLPLEVVPQPRSILRVGVVIITNADPAAGTEVDELISQLGDPSWAKREEAYNSLKSLGPAALPKLKAATKNKDMEIVWRAEKLLAAKEAK